VLAPALEPVLVLVSESALESVLVPVAEALAWAQAASALVLELGLAAA
jgi:hypothetical protein